MATKAHKIVTAVVMPAGEYWVGDPCYSVPDSRWDEYLAVADYLNAETFLLGELDGKPVLGVTTAYGDGVYTDESGRAYPVDAGLIGVTPAELVEGTPFGSHLVTFASDFTCSYDEGTITLGNISIDTDPDEEEDEPCYGGCGYTVADCRCDDETEDDDEA